MKEQQQPNDKPRFDLPSVVILQSLVINFAGSYLLSTHPDSKAWKDIIELARTGSLAFGAISAAYYGIKNLDFRQEDKVNGEEFGEKRWKALGNMFICLTSIAPCVITIKF
ncbi:MAG: hypothetical protein WCO33_00120 [bacterium]